MFILYVYLLNFLLFMTFSTSSNYGNAFGISDLYSWARYYWRNWSFTRFDFEQHSIHINVSGVQHLWNKDVLLVKVQWFSNPMNFTLESREFIEQTWSGFLFHALYGELSISNFFILWWYAFMVVTFCPFIPYDCEDAISLRRGVCNNPVFRIDL